MAPLRLITNTDQPAAHPWPDDVLVQGGGRGVVLDRQRGTYRTAFVEAFPHHPPTFLRGEGESLAEAEDACWAQFERYRDCPHGVYERGGYRNGSGFCTTCGTWMNKVFEPLPDESSERGLLDRVFADQDPAAAAEVIGLVANADRLPTKAEARAEPTPADEIRQHHTEIGSDAAARLASWSCTCGASEVISYARPTGEPVALRLARVQAGLHERDAAASTPDTEETDYDHLRH
jgi:hypothetical protein